MAITFHPDGRVTGNTFKSPGSVIQTVSATTTSTVQNTTTTYADTGLTASITISANSKVLMLVMRE